MMLEGFEEEENKDVEFEEIEDENPGTPTVSTNEAVRFGQDLSEKELHELHLKEGMLNKPNSTILM